MKKSRYLMMFVSMVMLVSLLVGCAKPTPIETPFLVSTLTEPPTAVPSLEPTVVLDTLPVTITDALGRSIQFDAYPTKIVVAGKATTLLLHSMFMFPEAAERVISYEDRNQTGNDFIKTIFPQMAETMLLEMNAGPEQIAPLKPDLVVLKTYMQESLGTPLDTLGIKVVYLDLETPEKFFADLRTIGKIFGNSPRAEELVALYQANDAFIADSLKGLTDADKPTVLMLQYSSKGGEVAFGVPPLIWLQTMIVEQAGGTPVWSDAATDSGWTTVSLEQIAAWNPEVILIVDYKGKAVRAVETLKQNPSWQELAAVKNERIYAFPVDFLSWDQPDTRWGLGELWLAYTLHPAQFPDFKMQRRIISFYKKYYGLDEGLIFDKVIPLVKGT